MASRAPAGEPLWPLRAALADMVEGARLWPQWYTLGNLDIRLRFRRSGLGAAWSSLSFVILVAALGFVYSRVLGEPAGTYLPWLVLGLFVWNFVATTLQEACNAYVHGEHLLKQVYVPRTTLVYRTLWRNLVLLAFNACAVAAVLLLCGTPLGAEALLALPGLVLILLGLAPASLILAIATARHRAVARIVATLIPIGMLVTPVIWRPSTPALRTVAEWNPFYFAIELVRGPILGEVPAAPVWIAAAALAAAGLVAAALSFAAARSRIPYWL